MELYTTNVRVINQKILPNVYLTLCLPIVGFVVVAVLTLVFVVNGISIKFITPIAVVIFVAIFVFIIWRGIEAGGFGISHEEKVTFRIENGDLFVGTNRIKKIERTPGEYRLHLKSEHSGKNGFQGTIMPEYLDGFLEFLEKNGKSNMIVIRKNEYD